MGSREALALCRLDELESSGDSEGAPSTGMVAIDGERIFLGVLGRDPRGESVGELDLCEEGEKKGKGWTRGEE